jgi:hypothetical protein
LQGGSVVVGVKLLLLLLLLLLELVSLELGLLEVATVEYERHVIFRVAFITRPSFGIMR